MTRFSCFMCRTPHDLCEPTETPTLYVRRFNIEVLYSRLGTNTPSLLIKLKLHVIKLLRGIFHEFHCLLPFPHSLFHLLLSYLDLKMGRLVSNSVIISSSFFYNQGLRGLSCRKNAPPGIFPLHLFDIFPLALKNANRQ